MLQATCGWAGAVKVCTDHYSQYALGLYHQRNSTYTD